MVGRGAGFANGAAVSGLCSAVPANTPDRAVGRDVELTLDEVRKVASLSRLALDGPSLERYRGRLSSILGFMEALRRLDLEGVAPMTHPSDAGNRWDEDVARPPMARDLFMRMAPEAAAPFIKVPKVLDEGAGA